MKKRAGPDCCRAPRNRRPVFAGHLVLPSLRYVACRSAAGRSRALLPVLTKIEVVRERSHPVFVGCVFHIQYAILLTQSLPHDPKPFPLIQMNPKDRPILTSAVQQRPEAFGAVRF